MILILAGSGVVFALTLPLYSVFFPLIFQQVKEEVFSAGFNCDDDIELGDTLNKRIRNAQVEQYNYIFGKSMFLLDFIFSCE